MNRIHLLHRTFVTLNIGAMITGIGRDNFADISLNIILLFFLMLALRIKFWIDDEAYFEDVEKEKLEGGAPFYVGFALAILSWAIWLFAGFFIKNIELSALLMVATLTPSTFWIVATMVRKGAYTEQILWLFFNVFYVVGFTLLFFARADWNPFSQTPDKYIAVVLAQLILLFFLDLIVTRIIELRRRTNGK
ncbi:MAG: hypothetical protein A3I66_24245 [Burkholderiales bacterium RIFCSPLOWO2_02_FULL_57_36]|nr:MAG: hypothetical protein A3I66_24245 [Burkholderiales bacterium RIFCSPLOWO2_02_FULL_57_36]